LLSYVKGVVDLTRQTQTCWLIDPFLGSVAVGDVINLTAFYYMSPQQQIMNGRCVSQLAGSFVAFDITKVNPFNQLIGKNSKLAEFFFSCQKQCDSKSSAVLTL